MIHPVRVRSAWSQLSVLFAVGGASLIAFVFVQLIIIALAGHGTGPVTLESLPMAAVKLQQLFFSAMVFGLTGYLFAKFTFSARPGYYLGLRPAANSAFYWLAALLLLCSFPTEEWLGDLNKQIPLWTWMVTQQQANDRQLQAFLKVRNGFDPAVNLVIMAAVPAICEELCFRGALQRIVIRICGRPWPGIVVAAFLFSFLHFEFEGFLPRMFLGVLLGAAYWYSGSLWVAIVAHFLFNAVQIVVAMDFPALLKWMDGISPATMVICGLVSMAIVVGLLIRMRRLSTVTYAGEYEQS